MFESAGLSWIVLSWSLIPGDVLITAQIIFVSGGGIERNITLEGSVTSVNVTDLQPGTEYSFRVIAVASGGQTSAPSVFLTASTSELEGISMCNYNLRADYITIEKMAAITMYGST